MFYYWRGVGTGTSCVSRLFKFCPLSGKDWVVVEPPEGSRLQQVAVGVESVWAVTRDHRVWFRRGLEKSDNPSANTVTGTSWLQMVGSLNTISVGPNDQVSSRKSILEFHLKGIYYWLLLMLSFCCCDGH